MTEQERIVYHELVDLWQACNERIGYEYLRWCVRSRGAMITNADLNAVLQRLVERRLIQMEDDQIIWVSRLAIR